MSCTRIDRRVDEMVEIGLIDETRRLLAAGYDTPAVDDGPRLSRNDGLPERRTGFG